MSELDERLPKKFKMTFSGSAAELRDALMEHFKAAEETIVRNNRGGAADYAAGLEIGRQAGIQDVRIFLKKLVIADQ